MIVLTMILHICMLAECRPVNEEDSWPGNESGKGREGRGKEKEGKGWKGWEKCPQKNKFMVTALAVVAAAAAAAADDDKHAVIVAVCGGDDDVG